MAKLSREEQARREGEAYAYKLVKEKGIEALEEDWTSWADQAWIVATELGIEFPKDIQAEFEKRSGETR